MSDNRDIAKKREQLRADYLAKVEAKAEESAKPKSTLEMVGVTPSNVMGCGVFVGIAIAIAIIVRVISITNGAGDLVAEEKRTMYIAGLIFTAIIGAAIYAFVRSNSQRKR
jgi:hypothetical protein